MTNLYSARIPSAVIVSPFKNDKKVHGPWQDNESSVGPYSFHSAFGHHLRIQRRKQLREPKTCIHLIIDNFFFFFNQVFMFISPSSSLPNSHALEHLCVSMEGKHRGAAHSWTVQQAQRQALHEGIRRGLGCAVVDGSRDGGEGENGVNAHHVAVAELQHARQKCFRGLWGRQTQLHIVLFPQPSSGKSNNNNESFRTSGSGMC